MSTPIRFGGPVPQLAPSSMPSAGGVGRAGFSTLIQPSRAGAPQAAGISGRQVVAAALGGGLSPRSIVVMAARAVGGAVGGPVGNVVGNVVGGLVDNAGKAAEELEFLDQVRNYILTNSIFEATNMPLVESEL